MYYLGVNIVVRNFSQKKIMGSIQEHIQERNLFNVNFVENVLDEDIISNVTQMVFTDTLDCLVLMEIHCQVFKYLKVGP